MTASTSTVGDRRSPAITTRMLRIGEELAVGRGENWPEIEAAEPGLGADLEQSALRRQVGIGPSDLVALGEDRDQQPELVCGGEAGEVREGATQAIPVGGIRVLVETEVRLFDEACEATLGLRQLPGWPRTRRTSEELV